MNTESATTKYIGAVSALLIATALPRLAVPFVVHSLPGFEWGAWGSFIFGILVLLTGVGLLFRWRGIWYFSIAILVLCIYGDGVGLYTARFVPVSGPTMFANAVISALLHLFCLGILLRRDTRRFVTNIA
jgi:hypothetical protein